MAETLIAMKDLRGRVSLSRQEIYRRIKAGTFPESIQVSPARVAWVGSEVDAWIQNTIEQGRRKQ